MRAERRVARHWRPRRCLGHPFEHIRKSRLPGQLDVNGGIFCLDARASRRDVFVGNQDGRGSGAAGQPGRGARRRARDDDPPDPAIIRLAGGRGRGEGGRIQFSGITGGSSVVRSALHAICGPAAAEFGVPRVNKRPFAEFSGPRRLPSVILGAPE